MGANRIGVSKAIRQSRLDAAVLRAIHDLDTTRQGLQSMLDAVWVPAFFYDRVRRHMGIPNRSWGVEDEEAQP